MDQAHNEPKLTPAHFLTGAFLVVMLAAICFRIGCAFRLYGYADEDTCWLLASGRQMYETGRLMTSDPFTFTLTGPLILHQWLSELLMYIGYATKGLGGLLVVVALIGVLAMVLIPLRAGAQHDARAWAFLAACLAGMSAPVRCLIRPELISCIFLALCLLLLQKLRIQVETARSLRANRGEENATTKPAIQWIYVAAFTVMSAVWSNMHAGFFTGVALLSVYSVGFIAADIVGAKDREGQVTQLSGATKTLLLSAATSLAATALNPAGFLLWTYLPRLYFSPIHATIAELQPLTAAQLQSPAYRGFCWLACVSIIVAIVATVRMVRRREGINPFVLLSALLIYGAVFVSSQSIRFTTTAGILMIVESCALLSFMKQIFGPASGIFQLLANIESAVDVFYRRVIRRYPLSLEAICGTCAVAGANLVVSNSPLVLPQESSSFHPPTQGISCFLQKHHQGRIFANAAIGDMLIWYLKPQKSIFIDTRFDEFDDTIFGDYNKMINGSPECAELLRKYKIDWVFVTPQDHLADVLKEPQWTRVFSDHDATIFQRQNPTDSAPKTSK